MEECVRILMHFRTKTWYIWKLLLLNNSPLAVSAVVTVEPPTNSQDVTAKSIIHCKNNP